MKQILVIGVLALSCQIAAAQHLSRWVIGAGGNHLESQGVSISCTMGQSGMAGTLESGSLHITVGFQQMELEDATSTHNLTSDIDLRVYPNPFSHRLVVSVQTEFTGNLNYALYDLYGKLILNKRNIDVRRGGHQEIIHTLHLPSGMYKLSVTIDGSRQEEEQFHWLLVGN